VLDTLLDRSEGRDLPLPAALAERYGGPLRFPLDQTHVFANFVSTIDGIVSFGLPGRSQAALVSGGHAADLFILALLRAVADAVIVGAGTLRQEPASIWTPEHVFPQAADDFAALRKARRKPTRPLTVIASATGDLDLTLPAFSEGEPIVIVTTEGGARRLARAPKHVRIRALAATSAPAIVRAAQEESGGRLLLTEGGPTLLGSFLRDGALDELFLTISPRIAGRSEKERRISLVEGAAFDPADVRKQRLSSLKTADDYLFLRFASA